MKPLLLFCLCAISGGGLGTKAETNFFAAMVRKTFGKWSVVLNGENLLNFKQTQYERVVLPSQPLPGFRPLWATIDGRSINLTLMAKF